MKTVVVTGCAGFIGMHLCLALLEDPSTRVIGVDNLNSYYDPALKRERLRQIELAAQTAALAHRFVFRLGDVTDAAFVDSTLSNQAVDVVVNLAAQAGVRYSLENPRAYIESNLIGFFNVLDASRRHGVAHLVYASSSSVYGAATHSPYSEDQRTDSPVSLYAATKKSNEVMAHAYSHLYGMRTTGLRFFTVYGPFGRPDMAYFSFADKMRRGERIQLFNHGDMWRDFTYIDDIIAGLLRVIRSEGLAERAAVYNIGHSSPVRLDEFVDVLEGCLQREGLLSGRCEREYLPMQLGDVYRTCADVSALERDFGFRPSTSLSDGLARFAHWYKGYVEGRS